MYAIVDIETTGGYAAANGITEISIHVFDGSVVTEKFETLINPGQPIPYYISAMTGISDKMVANAPVFEDVAEKIIRHSEALGGISRLTFQMDNAGLSQEKLLNAIELIGQRVIPAVMKSEMKKG